MWGNYFMLLTKYQRCKQVSFSKTTSFYGATTLQCLGLFYNLSCFLFITPSVHLAFWQQSRFFFLGSKKTNNFSLYSYGLQTYIHIYVDFTPFVICRKPLFVIMCRCVEQINSQFLCGQMHQILGFDAIKLYRSQIPKLTPISLVNIQIMLLYSLQNSLVNQTDEL